MEFAVPEVADVVIGRKNFKTAAKSVGRQTLKKQLGLDGKKGIAGRVIPRKSAKQTSRSGREFFNTRFSLIKSSNFRYQPFVAVTGNLAGKVPVVEVVLLSREQEIYTTSLDEIGIEFEFQTCLNYYVDLRLTYLALELKFVKGRG